MAEIIATGGGTDSDLKQNPLKSLWEKFSNLDKFTKVLIISTILFLIIASILTKVLIDTRSSADVNSAGEGRLSFSCDSGNYVKCLKNQFNVSFQFDIADSSDDIATTSATPTPTPYPVPSPDEIAKFFYNTLSIPLSYQKYYVMFRGVGAKLKVGQGDEAGRGPRGAWAMVPKKGTIVFYPVYFTGSTAFKRYILIHESAHIIAGPSDGKELQSNLYSQVFKSGLDSSCFNADQALKTYQLKPKNQAAEIFAESVVNTLLCKPGEKCNPGRGGAIADFQATCANTYNFVWTNVLGMSLSPTAGPTISETSTPTPTSLPEPPTKADQQFVETSMSFSPTDDTYLRGDFPDKSYPKLIYLRSKSTNANFLSYIKFDLSKLSGLNVSKAVLQISQPADLGAPGKINIRETSNKWNENSISYKSRPAVGDVMASFVNDSRGKTYEIDITDWVNDNAGKKASLVMESATNAMAVFYSSNSNKNPVKLKITAEQPDEVFQGE